MVPLNARRSSPLNKEELHFSFPTLMNSFSLIGIMMLPVTPLFIALFTSEDSTCFVAGVEENTISKQLSFSGMPRSIESIWSSCKGTTLGVIFLYRFSKRISRATSVVPYRSQISGIFYHWFRRYGTTQYEYPRRQRIFPERTSPLALINHQILLF